MHLFEFDILLVVVDALLVVYVSVISLLLVGEVYMICMMDFFI